MSLSAIDRERLSNPHLTRAASNNLGKGNNVVMMVSLVSGGCNVSRRTANYIVHVT